VNTDIRNILQLIAEVADLNIVWGDDVEGRVSLVLDEVPWDQALEMVLKPNGLTYQIENDVLWVVPKATLVDMEIKERNRKSALLAQKRLQGIFEPKILEYLIIKHRKAEDIYLLLVGNPNTTPPTPGVLDIEAGKTQEKEKGEEETGKTTKIVAQDIYITYDPGTNMIIANGVRSKVEKVKELIARLDVPEKQVLIEARVVEATSGFTRDLGVRWTSLDGQNPGFKREWFNTGSNSTGSGQFSTNSPAGWSPTIGLALGWLTNGGLGTVALDASIALAETDHTARLISAPKVLTVNGGKAVISRGTVEYFPIVSLDTVDIKEIPAILSLTVTPTVSADNSHVTMFVQVTDDKRLPATQRTLEEGTTETPPGRTEKSIETKLMVRTGDTVVIGGIYQEDRETTTEGVPWLKDVPLLGWLFKAEIKKLGKVELLIFLTPTVVKTTGDAMAAKGQL
jgi:type IV pilus assembly protein PilQ